MFKRLRRMMKLALLSCSPKRLRELEQRLDLQTEVERRILTEKENEELRGRLKELQGELEDVTLELEVQRSERENAHNLVGLLKSARAGLERKIKRYTPTEVIYHMIETTDQPCLFLTPDLAILKGNKASTKDETFKYIPRGVSLLELDIIDLDEITELKKLAIASERPFEYQSRKLKLKNWSIIPAKDNEIVLGYILTKKGVLKRTLERAQKLYATLVGEKEAEKIIQVASLSTQQDYS